MKNIIWFSCGAASAVTAKVAVGMDIPDLHIVYCDTGGEHETNRRFLHDIEKWIGKEIIILKNEKYSNHFDAMLQTRYIVGVRGAACTGKLKREVREKFQKPDDVHFWGYTAEEKHRLKRIQEREADRNHRSLLIEAGITKEQCLGLIWRAGIELPEMYKLGYNHNNCIGCVKGGAGYWNKIRIDFPDVFGKMITVENEIGATVLRDKNGARLPLSELHPDAGNFAEEKPISCDMMCELTYLQLP